MSSRFHREDAATEPGVTAQESASPSEPVTAGPDPAVARSAPPAGAPDAPDQRRRHSARPADEEYVPFVPRGRREISAMVGSDVTGDVVLATDQSATDLAAISAARLGGRAIALAGVVVVAGVVLSRLLGEVRLAVLGAEFGAGANLDAFTAAFRIPDTLFQLVAAGAIGSAVVPVASELMARGDTEGARKLISTITNLMVLVLAPLAAIAWLFAPVLVPLIAPGFESDRLNTTIDLTRLMLLSPILLAVGAVMAAGLNSLGIFGPPAMAPNVYNLVIIAAAIVLTPFFGIQSLAIGVVLGALGHVLIQARPFVGHRLYRPAMDLSDPAVRQTLLLMGPRALGLGATQLVFLVYTVFQSTLPRGEVTIFNYSFMALQIPVGLLGVPLGIVLLPPLSRAFALGQHDQFRALADQSLRLLLFVTILLTGLMLALATPTIALLYGYGKLTPSDQAAMVPVFIVFLAGLVAHVMIALLAPIFYAGKDTRTPVTAALLAVAIDIGGAIILFPFFHLEGLALAIGLGAWAEVVILVTLMEKRIGFDLRPMVRHSISFVGGACVASAAAYLAARFVENYTGGPVSLLARVAELAPAGLVGLAVYVAWARAFRLPELGGAVQLARTLLGRGESSGHKAAGR
jgi:putative peptidoglycan lipid II flippase